jgi:two-component system LytT family response regulator
MSRFRILIVDDEPLSRTRLRRMIALDPDCELTAECSNGADAVTACNRLRPDIVFLDVQMPGMDGFEVMRAIAETQPLVIVTSAHGDHARVFESLKCAKAWIARDPAPALAPPHHLPDRIAVKNRDATVFVKLDEIDWFEAADNYVTLHRGRETHLVRVTMTELESKLDPARFVRVHRSAIVNLERIKELRPWFRGDLIILRDGTKLRLAKNHRENLESRLLLGAA